MEAAVLVGPGRVEPVGLTPSTSRGKTLTGHATPGTDGAYTELIAATAFEYHRLHLRVLPVSTTQARYLIDFAIGAGGSEKIFFADMPAICNNTGGSNVRGASFGEIVLPYYIPQGARIAARVHRSNTASATIDVALHGEQIGPRGLPPFRRCTAYGVDLANARGTVVDAGGTANTLGTITTIANTTKPVRQLYIAASRHVAALETVDSHMLLNIYQGASDKLLIQRLPLVYGSSSDHLDTAFFGPFDVNVPAGTDLSAALQASTNTSAVRQLALVLYGLD